MATKNDEQQGKFGEQDELSKQIEEINPSGELMDQELEGVEGGGTCVCRSSNTNNSGVDKPQKQI